MAKNVHKVRCPCCRELLRIDTSGGKIVVEAGESKAPDSGLDDLLDAQKSEKGRLGDAFDQAARAQDTQTGEFDDMFSSALDEAKKDKDKKPRNPFDLD